MIHRDIKPANILAVVTEGQLVKVLLADFGEAKQVTRTMTVRTMAGTPIYMAPEMRDVEVRKGPKADVFSAGVVMIEMSTGFTPNPGPETRREGGRRMMVPEEERRAADLQRIRDPFVFDLAGRCIVDDDEQRADAAEIYQHLQTTQVRAVVPDVTVFVRDVATNQSFPVASNLAMSVAQFRGRLHAAAGAMALHPSLLVFAGQQLEDDRNLDHYSILDGTTVHVVNSQREQEAARQREQAGGGGPRQPVVLAQAIEDVVSRLDVSKLEPLMAEPAPAPVVGAVAAPMAPTPSAPPADPQLQPQARVAEPVATRNICSKRSLKGFLWLSLGLDVALGLCLLVYSTVVIIAWKCLVLDRWYWRLGLVVGPTLLLAAWITVIGLHSSEPAHKKLGRVVAVALTVALAVAEIGCGITMSVRHHLIFDLIEENECAVGDAAELASQYKR
jgi:hypothetical protein